MSGQITPEQIDNLITLSVVIMQLVGLRLIGLAVWRKWFADSTSEDDLTQEERDERLITRRARK